MNSSTTITLGPWIITAVEVTSPDPFVMGVSATQQIVVTVSATRYVVTEDSGVLLENFSLDPVESGVTYVSANESICTVNATGLITGVAQGDTLVTVKAGGITDVIAVTINNSSTVASVDVTPTSASTGVGGTAQFAAVVRNAGGQALTGKTVTWNSATTSVATIGSDSGTEAHTATATGVAEGTSNIKATSETVDSALRVLTITATSGTLYFADKFDSGNRSKVMGNARWLEHSGTVVESFSGPFGGDNFVMRCDYSPSDPNLEQFYAIGTDVTELFFGLYMLYPTNYVHQGSVYNKFLRFWAGGNETSGGKWGYVDYHNKCGFSTAPRSTSPFTSSAIHPEYGFKRANGTTTGVGSGGGNFDGSSVQAGNQQPTIMSDSGQVIGPTHAMQLGVWTKVTGSVKMASGHLVPDGHLKLKFGTTQVINRTDVAQYAEWAGAKQHFEYGYILGAANSGFATLTQIRWTRFRIASTEALADPDLTTGW